MLLLNNCEHAFHFYALYIQSAVKYYVVRLCKYMPCSQLKKGRNKFQINIFILN